MVGILSYSPNDRELETIGAEAEICLSRSIIKGS